MKRINVKKKSYSIDRKLLVISVALTAIGLVAIADVSAPIAIADFYDKYYFVKQQMVWAVVGLAMLVILANVKYTFWEYLAAPLFYASLFLLLLVFVPGLGSYVYGARRWLILGPISFQPSEFVKLSLSLYLAKVVSKDKKIFANFLPIIIVSILVMLQPDLGTTLVLVSIGMAEIFVSGVSLAPYLIAIVISVLSSFLLVITSKYRKARLFTFINQAQDPLQVEYHMRQVLIALGAGGVFGVGLGQSRQKYLFLPQTATDSIFAVIAEETGFVGASLLVVFYLFFVLAVFRISRNAPDKFSQTFSVGVATWLGFQAFLNIGSMVAVVPLTGITLPFISYGGSSLVSVLIAIGIILNISKYAKK